MTNTTLDIIKNRRSHRIFTEEPVSREQIEAIVEAGLFAPSAHNHQSWHFTVIQDAELLNQFSQAAKEVLKHNKVEDFRNMGNNDKFHIFYHAPVVILISGENSGMLPETDCAAATQNMLIAAESLGLGSCWIGFARFPFFGPQKDELLQKLQIPEGYTPFHAVAIGHKKIDKLEAPERRKHTVTYL